MNKVGYRPDIDGLRAVAVILVVLNHLGFSAFSGGFIGVDVFFVISGFLIGKILLAERQAGTFSFVTFYEKRIRRLFPMLVFVCVSVFLTSFLFTDPVYLRDTSGWIFSSLTLISNVYAYFTTGYFSDAAHMKPMLHAWSLSVEEQFYLIFPIILIMVRYSALKIVLAVIAIISFVYSFYASIYYPDNAYYFVFSRAWEFCVGVYASRYYPRVSGAVVDYFVGFSLLVILISSFVIDESYYFPGISALPIVMASSIILRYGGSSRVSAVIANRVLVRVGLISYSIYLLHQPILALMYKYYNLSEFTALSKVVVLIVICFLSYFTHRYIETPFRYAAMSVRQVYITYFMVTTIVASLALLTYASAGFPQRFLQMPDTPVKNGLHSPDRNRCHTSGEDYLAVADACVLNDAEVGVVVFGDSHGVELAYALSNEIPTVGVKQLTFSACSFGVAVPGCRQWLYDVENYLIDVEERLNVIVIFRYGIYSDIEGYYEKFRNFVSVVASAGHEVIIVSSIPKLSDDVFQLYYPLGVWKSKPDHEGKVMSFDVTGDIKCDFLTKGLLGFECVDPIDQGIGSLIEKEGKLLYFDDNHLSIYGAEELIGRLLPLMEVDYE